jgi:hypothetical protein
MNRLFCGFVSAFLLTGVDLAQNVRPAEPPEGLIYIQPEPGDPAQKLASALPMMLQEGRIGPANSQEGQVQFFTMSMAGNEVIKNAPYTATATTESTQTLADGNHIVNKNSTFLARDSQGRTRREEAMQHMGPLAIEGPELVMINDPVGLTNYTLIPKARYANVVKYKQFSDTPEGLQRKLAARRNQEGDGTTHITWKADSESSEPNTFTNEDLGTQVIEGVSCQGRRETTTIPAGKMGNERPIVISTEVWSSPDLHGIVLKKHTDPRVGETVYRLTNIKLGEPDASLFQVPAGYETQTEGEGMQMRHSKVPAPGPHE